MKLKKILTLLLLLTATTAAAFDFMVDGIYYNINGNEATVTHGYSEYDYPPLVYSGDVTIPDSVTFDGITYPVTAIGEWAFGYSENVTSVSIPNSVTSIGTDAFYNCHLLTSVTIPSSVTTIDEEAFCGCQGLTSVTIPSSVATIGDGAFSFCENLTSLTVESGNVKYDCRDNCNAIIETASNTLIAGCQNTVIPNTVTAIGNNGFSGCSGLTSLLIPNSVTAIGYFAFGCCNGLNSVDIPNSVTFIGEDAFCECENLTSVTIGNSVTTIDFGAFSRCHNLTSVLLGNSVTAIGDAAFLDCHSLTSLFIPKSVTTIGVSAFNACSGLKTIVVESGNTAYDSRDNCNAIIETASNTMIAGCDNTIIPNTITAINSEAFYGCQGLTSVTIPGGVTFIGQAAFMNCHALMDVYSYITNPSDVSVGTFVFFYDYGYGDPSDGDYSGRTLHVPYGTTDAYQNEWNWSHYFGQIVEDLVPEDLRGDVNGDGEVDIVDVNTVIDIILGQNAQITAADVNRDDEINIIDVDAIIDIILGMEEETIEHEYVDLGLPSGTLWATCNVGANFPEEYGDYFAWGETEPKRFYDWSTYKWCDGSIDALTKYCLDSDFGSVDNKSELEFEDDAAYVNWGPSWRMPTLEQFRELYDNCTGEWMEMAGVNGWMVTGPNGNSMFLPAAGVRRYEILYMAGTDGNYWANTLRGMSYNANELLFNSRYMIWQINFNYRYCGHNVRPVRVPQD